MTLSNALLGMLLAATARAQSMPDVLFMHELQATPGSCLDGSPARVYQRNCTGDWDARPGDEFCNVTQTWVVVVGGASGDVTGAPAAGAYCYDDRSCAARSANLTSSLHLPRAVLPPGLLSVAAEENPNLYLQSTVVIPDCTSDLLAGAGARGGAALVDAALALLFTPATPAPNAAFADRVVLVGGAGAMARLDELADALVAAKRAATGNASAALAVWGVCDGCLLLEPAPAFAAPACTTDADCPPSVGLPRLAARVGGLARPAWCGLPDAWRCYTAAALAPALAAARTPALVLAAQYDATALAALGVPSPLRGAGLAYAQAVFAPAARAAAASVPYAFSPACARPALAASTAWFRTLVPHADAFNHTRNASAANAAYDFFELSAPGGGGPAGFGAYADRCAGFAGCNPSGCSEG